VIAVTVTLTWFDIIDVLFALIALPIAWLVISAALARQEERADQKHYRKWWAPVDPKTAQRLRDGEL